MKPLLLLSLSVLCYLFSHGQSSSHHAPCEAKVISKEINSVTGTITFNIYVKVQDSMKILSGTTFTKPGYYSTSVGASPSTGVWRVPNDSLSYTVTFTHSTGGWLPYFPDEFYFKIRVLQGIDTTIVDAHGYIFFTPWNTVEVWDNYDFGIAGRVWKQKGPYTDSTRVYIPKINVPISNFNAEDTMPEEWMENFEMVDVPGLPFWVKQVAVHPDTIQYYSDHYGDDTIFHPWSDTLLGGGPSSVTIVPKYTGTVKGRLVTNYLNDLNQTVTMPLAGVFVMLKEKDEFWSQTLKTGHTDADGNFELSYSDRQMWEGGEIELWLEFKSKNQIFNYKVSRPNLDFVDITILAAAESFEFRKGDTRNVGENGGEINFGDIVCMDHAHWVTHWVHNAYTFASSSSRFQDYGEGLQVILNASGSKQLVNALLYSERYVVDGGIHTHPTIKLTDFDDDHENTIYHEFGHHLMYALQKYNFIYVAGYPHNDDGNHGTICKRVGVHHFWHEEHSRLSWTEGFADGIMMILDAAHWTNDNEYAFDRIQFTDFSIGRDRNNPFELRGTFRRLPSGSDPGIPKDINNGFKSEYYFACAMYDLWDGPNKGLPTPDPITGTLPFDTEYHPYNDRQFDNLDGNWTVPDDVSIDFVDLVEPIVIHDGASDKLQNMNDYFKCLMNDVFGSNCPTQRGIAKCLYQNRVVLNISDVDTKGEDWNTMMSSDEIAEEVTDNDGGKLPPFCVSISDAIVYGREIIENVPNKVFAFNNDASAMINTNISDNLRLGYNFTLSTQQSTFNLNTFFTGRNLSLETCGDVVWSLNNVQFNVGEGSNTNVITFNSGSKLILDGSVDFILNENSKLVIAEGAILEYHPGANIVLNGTNAILEIRGELQIMDGATFTVQGGGSGYGFVRLYKHNTNTPLITSPTSDGKFLLDGDNNDDLLLEIDGNNSMMIGRDVEEFTLTNCKVLLGTDSRIMPEVERKLYIENVKVDQLYNNSLHNGLYVCGVANEIKYLRMYGGKQGIMNYQLGPGYDKLLNLKNSIIDECEIGIYTKSSGISFEVGQIKGYSKRGWLSEGQNKPSLLSGVTIYNDLASNTVAGMEVTGSQVGNTTMNYSRVWVNPNGALFRNCALSLVKCNEFQGNATGIRMEVRSNLNMSNSYTAFDDNDMHFSSAFHGVLVMNNGHNGFFNQSSGDQRFFASLEPYAQTASVFYNPSIPPPAPLNYTASDNYFEGTITAYPGSGSGYNYRIDERNTRPLTFLPGATYANKIAWETARQGVCGNYPITDITDNLNSGSKGRLGEFRTSNYSGISGVIMTCGVNVGTSVVSVVGKLTDSLYKGFAPDYDLIIDQLIDVVTCQHPNYSQTMRALKYETFSHILTAYSIGVSKGEIAVSEGSVSTVTTDVVDLIDDLIDLSQDDSLPWKNHEFDLTFAKAEVLRLAYQRTDAIGVLTDALSDFSDDVDQKQLYKWICINEGEIEYLAGDVTIDSIWIDFPCFDTSIDWGAFKVGIEPITKNEIGNAIVVYPNPSSDQILVDASGEIITKIEIFDLMGRLVYSTKPEDEASIKSIHPNLINGVYVIQIDTETKSYKTKHIVQR